MSDALRKIAATQGEDQFNQVAEALIASELLAEPKIPLQARFALSIWTSAKHQGATDVEALAMVYHAAQSHACEALGISQEQFAAKLVSYLSDFVEHPNVH